MGQATVNVTNINFVDVINTAAAGAARYSTATFTLQPNPPAGIAQNAAGRLIVTADTDIIFAFPAGTAFSPIGISHLQKSGRGDSCGKGNFPKQHIAINDQDDGSATIKIRDKCRDRGAPGALVWEIYIAIQNTSGAIGIIDPEISNEN
jgi:hypothetical protein